MLSGTLLNYTTHRTTFAFADQDMPKYAKICQEMKGKRKHDKSIIHLPRQSDQQVALDG